MTRPIILGELRPKRTTVGELRDGEVFLRESGVPMSRSTLYMRVYDARRDHGTFCNVVNLEHGMVQYMNPDYPVERVLCSIHALHMKEE